MGKTLGVKAVMDKQYRYLDTLDQEWVTALGVLADPFRLVVFGNRKNGKTHFVMKFCKALAKIGKVYYNSVEEGDSRTIQEAFKNVGMHEVQDGRFMLGDRDSYEQMVAKLSKKNAGKFVVVDSRDYMKLTIDQYKKLVAKFPRKSFIIICWEANGKPAGKHAQEIEYCVGAVTHVSNFTARTVGRYGHTEPYTIWDRKPAPRLGDQLQLALQEATVDAVRKAPAF